MVTAVTMYETSDGEKFEDLLQAHVHQSELTNAIEIAAFLDTYYPSEPGVRSGPSRSIAGKAIGLWLAWRQEDGEDGDPVEVDIDADEAGVD